VNHNRWTAVCLVACVPLVLYLANRRSAVEHEVVRFATFNVALHREGPGELLRELRGGTSGPARRLAAIVQRVQPDVLLLCEVDRDDAAEAAAVFAREYLAVPQQGLVGIDYRWSFAGAVNTGEPSGYDLDRDGTVGGAGDARGHGAFPGQYGMVLLSRHPILTANVRTFRTLRWSTMPGALRPGGWYADDAWAALPLSSKSHWDVPVGIGDPAKGGRVVHVLCSHPTPPVFDGPEDRNGARNHDEIRFWSDYLSPERAQWLADDGGGRGGLPAGAHFVVLGDLNCDPHDGDGRREAIAALLAHPRVQDAEPRSAGGDEQAKRQFGANARHAGDPALDTADFDDTTGPGNLRVDFALPSRTLRVARAGVFWPLAREPGAELVGASDHRLVWVDVASR
jgi:endonuclease/exonuclease/phosphatase family metal-dependent hydrolase